MKKATEWWCYLHSEYPLKPHHLKPDPKPEAKQPKPGPKLWDKAIDYNPKYQNGSLHIRKGWAGQSPPPTRSEITHILGINHQNRDFCR